MYEQYVPSREGLLEQVYDCLENNISLETIHIPHSDVFFVREALEARYKQEFTLEQAEEYMLDAGWTDTNQSTHKFVEQGWTDGSNARKNQEQDEGTWAEWSEQAEEDSLT
jgi:hypothetical protein